MMLGAKSPSHSAERIALVGMRDGRIRPERDSKIEKRPPFRTERRARWGTRLAADPLLVGDDVPSVREQVTSGVATNSFPAAQAVSKRSQIRGPT